MTRKTSVAILAAAVVLLTAGAAWLYAQSPSGGTIGPNTVNPSTIVVNTSTLVVFTSHISDNVKNNQVLLVRTNAAGTPTDIVGKLNDQGKGTDATKHDKICTARVVLNEPTPGQIYFRVAARFKPAFGKKDEPDDDWDTDLADFNAIKDQTAKRSQLSKLLKKLATYTLSELITINVWQQTDDASHLIQVLYPPTLYAVSAPASAGPAVIIQSSPNFIAFGELPSTITSDNDYVTTGYAITMAGRQYTTPFTINQWLADRMPDIDVDTTRPLVISGHSGYLITFKNGLQSGKPFVVVPDGNMVITIAYTSTFDPDTPPEDAGLTIFSQVLNTVHILH